MKPLSKRETQIVEALYRIGSGSVADVIEEMESPPSYSAVRAQLRILEEKGQVQHREEGGKYVYQPTTPQAEAGQGMLSRVLETFFDGSPSRLMAALVSEKEADLSDQELAELKALIDEAAERRQ